MDASLENVLSSVKAPINNEKVYKEECMFSFDTPDSETGLYVCMTQHYGFGKRYVEEYHRNSGCRVFLHMKRKRKILPQNDEPDKKKPTRLAIDVDGGFDSSQTKYDIVEENSVIVLPEWKSFTLPDETLPGMTQLTIAAIIAAESATKSAELAVLSNTWEGDIRKVSKHADELLQFDNGVKVPPSGWKCARCDLTNNLWLNLTDGAILCGRRYHDGSGGNNHALEHYAEHKYPLAVKLGTITPDGGDVFSYDEDDMVQDPGLALHLAHFGIDIMAMKKTEQTMLELELDANTKLGEWDLIQESGKELKPVYGPGYTGMRNLGNSCYMNSCMQVLFNIPHFQRKYPEMREKYFKDVDLDAVTASFNTQMAKLGYGLLSGDYSIPVDDNSEYYVRNGISPNVFKLLVGKGHHEFASKKQQDVHEYLLHLFNLVERNSRGSDNPLDSLRFKIEERRQCTESKCVSYGDVDNNYILSLPVSMSSAQNVSEVAAYEQHKKELEAAGKSVTDPKEVVRPRISLNSCLRNFVAVEMIDDFYSTAVKKAVTVSKCSNLKTFPPYLFIHIRKFTVTQNWTPKKLDISLDAPEVLDLTSFRGHGRQPGEEEFPADDRASEAAPTVEIDEGVVAQLVDMGFAVEGCKKAVFHTNNTGVEPAMNWVMEHMGDADFDSPFVPPGAANSRSSFTPNEEGISLLTAMGFTRDQSIKALKATDNNLERAGDWVFSHADELDTMPMETEETPQSSTAYNDGPGKYRLRAFISHMGQATDTGHYVCHILKEGQWVIYNDEKVAESQKPPIDLAYVYLYERID
ncbi:ubiquitin carboxyl-terminal hydrolase 5-like [Watersipora subatra]|uniref:ubiquitin carboxyl-terminal hydrolase 5-like n=1 Tax=Watersipora subatra TaxID=2589382 RepID=UPI00355AF5D6